MTRFGHVLFALLPGWRGLCDKRLPLWGFYRKRARLPRLEALRAERRCRLCAARPHCKARSAGPVAGCPNAGLFAAR
jgi:hypothetical protein